MTRWLIFCVLLVLVDLFFIILTILLNSYDLKIIFSKYLVFVSLLKNSLDFQMISIIHTSHFTPYFYLTDTFSHHTHAFTCYSLYLHLSLIIFSSLYLSTYAFFPPREDLVLENIYAASRSPSHQLMPISVVHLPPHKLSTASAPPSCLWLPNKLQHNLHSGHSTHQHIPPSMSPNLPSQWLDLMVGPGGGEGQDGRGGRWVLKGLPLGALGKRKARPTASVVQHPPVFMQRHTSLSRPQSNRGHPKHHKSKAPKSGHPGPAPINCHRKPVTQDSLESLRAGLRRTAQRVMKLRVGLEKSQSFDTGASHSREAGVSFKGNKTVGRLLKARNQSRSSLRQPHLTLRCARESVTSPDGCVDDWDLDSPDIVELEGMEEADIGEEDEEGPEVTSIQYSFKRVSAAHSDPTLNRSVFAKQRLAAARARPPVPIQLVSSDEEDCSSGQASSGDTSPDCLCEPTLPACTTGKKKFYLSEDSLESGEVSLLNLPAAPCRSTSDSHLTELDDNYFITHPRPKSHSFGGKEHFMTTIQGHDDLHLIGGRAAGCHNRKEPLPPITPITPGSPFDPPTSTINTKRCHGMDGEHYGFTMSKEGSARSGRETLNLPLVSLHPLDSHTHSTCNHHLLPAIAVTPSTPVLPARSHPPHASIGLEGQAPTMQETSSVLTKRTEEGKDQTELTVTEASSVASFISASSSSSLSSSSSSSPSSSSSSLSTPPAICSIHPPLPPPPLSLSLLPPPPPPPPLVLSVSMENQEVLESALDVVVCAKCAPPSPAPPSPRPAPSLDMLAEVRPGSAPSVGSPKRPSARSRHTSGCYPPSVSRSPLPPEPDAPQALPASQANGVVGVGTGVGGTVTNSSPTHSGKLASPARTPGVSINRRSSDSDLSITPKG